MFEEDDELVGDAGDVVVRSSVEYVYVFSFLFWVVFDEDYDAYEDDEGGEERRRIN